MNGRSKKNIKAIFKKQLLLYLRNFMWIAPLIFIVMTAGFELFVVEENEAGNMLSMFGSMMVSMSIMQIALGFTTMDKASKNLKYMSMAGVKPFEYLTGTISALGIGAVVFVTLFSLNAFIIGQNFFLIFGLLILGAFVSIFAGVTIGLLKGGLWGTIISMVLGFSIFFSGINDTIDNALFWLYPRQIDLIIRRYILANPEIMYPREVRIVDITTGFYVILLNLAVIFVIFLWSNRKNRLEN